MRLLLKILFPAIFVFFFLAGFLFPMFLKTPEKDLPVAAMPKKIGPPVRLPPRYLPLKELVLSPLRSGAIRPVIRVQDSFQQGSEKCGNGQVDPGETFFNCPQDCGGRIYPIQNENKEYFYPVKPEETLLLVYSPVEECAQANSGVKIWQGLGNSWSLDQEYSLPEPITRNLLAIYTPSAEKIKIEPSGCFRLDLFGKGPLSGAPPEEKYTNYHNSKYGVSIDIISGWHAQEHDWEQKPSSADPVLVWQASFFHDIYGKNAMGEDAQSVIELSIEEFLGNNFSAAVRKSKVPCGIPLGEICQKFSSCEFGFQAPRYETKGGMGGTLSVGCGRNMRGMVFQRGNRIYKFLFLSGLSDHIMFGTKQIESMLKSIRFE